ncbi:hypothetical protein BU14_0071s0069, partial [Porphyra umbilicalis]
MRRLAPLRPHTSPRHCCYPPAPPPPRGLFHRPWCGRPPPPHSPTPNNPICHPPPATRPVRTLLIDNYDSYTYNLYQLLATVNGVPPTVVTNDAYPSLASAIAAIGPFDNIVVSPGPGTPDAAADLPALAADALASTAGAGGGGGGGGGDDGGSGGGSPLPVLGVCLGLQGLCAAAGARVGPAPDGPVHGRLATVERSPAGRGCPLLGRLPVDAWQAVRYHSLAVDAAGLPPWLTPTAWAAGVLMAVRHTSRHLYGVQFHPESVATEYGAELLAAFRDLTLEAATAAAAAAAAAGQPPGL